MYNLIAWPLATKYETSYEGILQLLEYHIFVPLWQSIFLRDPDAWPEKRILVDPKHYLVTNELMFAE